MPHKGSYKYGSGTPAATSGRARMVDSAVERAQQRPTVKSRRAPRVRDEVHERQIVRR